MGYAVVVLLLIVSFALAYMTLKSWRAYQVVLLWLVVVGSVAFSYLAVRTLKTYQVWRSEANKWEAEVATWHQLNEQLVKGKYQGEQLIEPSMAQLKSTLHILTVNRGSAWYDVTPDKVDAKTGVCQVTLKSQDSKGIVPKMVLFVFEKEPIAKGGAYLGEFFVSESQPENPTFEIKPNLPMDQTQAERLQASRGPWALYATMPTDNQLDYAELDDAQRAALYPKKSADERAEFAKKDRPLRDYEYFFHQNSLERNRLENSIALLEADLKRTVEAQKKTEQDIQYREAEKANLSSDFEKFQRSLEIVRQYAKTLKGKFGTLKGELATAMQATQQNAANFKSIQLKAEKEIDLLTNEQAKAE